MTSSRRLVSTQISLIVVVASSSSRRGKKIRKRNGIPKRRIHALTRIHPSIVEGREVVLSSKIPPARFRKLDAEGETDFLRLALSPYVFDLGCLVGGKTGRGLKSCHGKRISMYSYLSKYHYTCTSTQLHCALLSPFTSPGPR